MRVLVDTSAWADFLNGFPSVADALSDLLRGDDDVCTCGIVVAEVFQGLRRDAERDAIRRSFEDLIFLEPSGIRLYLRAAELYRGLREKGKKGPLDRRLHHRRDCGTRWLRTARPRSRHGRDSRQRPLEGRALASPLARALRRPHLAGRM